MVAKEEQRGSPEVIRQLEELAYIIRLSDPHAALVLETFLSARQVGPEIEDVFVGKCADFLEGMMRATGYKK